MPIDYGRLLNRTWEIFWRNRVLWILGFIVALGGSGLNLNFNFSSRDFSDSSQFNTAFSNFLTEWGGLLFAGFCLLVIIAIAFTFVRAGAEAGLIAATDHIARGGEPPSFGAAWRMGWPKALRLWLLYLVVGVLTFVAVLILMIPFFGFFIALVATGDPEQSFGGAGLLICCICLLPIVLIPLAIILSLIMQYAPRAIVIDDESIGQALGSGWTLLKANPWPSIVTGLIHVGVSIVQGIISFPVALIVAAPAIFAVMSNPEGFGPGTIATIIIFGLIAALLLAVIGALFVTFTSVLWTNLYRHLRGKPNGDLSPLPMYPGGGYPGQYNQPYGGQYGGGQPGTPTTQMPPYGQPQQPPYTGHPPSYGQPPQGQPGQHNPYGQPPQQDNPPDQGRLGGNR